MTEGFDFDRVREIWDRLSDAWDRNRALVSRFMRPVTADLVALVDAQPGETVLEVGTGQGETGFLIAEQLGPTGRLICIDLSAGMLERARAAAEGLGLTNVEFREMNAQDLDLLDASVDAVVGRLVYHLLPDPARAFAEAHRVLRPGGRLCFAVFGPDEHMRFDAALRETTAMRGLTLPPGLSYDIDLNEPGLIRALLADAGFEEVTVNEVPFVIEFADGDEVWRYITEMYGRQAELIRTLTPQEQDAFRDTLFEQLAPFRDDAGAYVIQSLGLTARARV